ncbi:hypothetical protein VIBNIWn13_1070061 [Vibrio nigripulchritudo Wn13]|nr:hypothetical protein VIBNIWn13_1070061 [Vibrio nigripulchritudo Wn13]
MVIESFFSMFCNLSVTEGGVMFRDLATSDKVRWLATTCMNLKSSVVIIWFKPN